VNVAATAALSASPASTPGAALLAAELLSVEDVELAELDAYDVEVVRKPLLDTLAVLEGP
jgi:hypothetical protein